MRSLRQMGLMLIFGPWIVNAIYLAVNYIAWEMWTLVLPTGTSVESEINPSHASVGRVMLEQLNGFVSGMHPFLIAVGVFLLAISLILTPPRPVVSRVTQVVTSTPALPTASSMTERSSSTSTSSEPTNAELKEAEVLRREPDKIKVGLEDEVRFVNGAMHWPTLPTKRRSSNP